MVHDALLLSRSSFGDFFKLGTDSIRSVEGLGEGKRDDAAELSYRVRAIQRYPDACHTQKLCCK